MFLQCLFFGATLVSIGVVGQYVARIYDESKSRPLYVLSRAVNVDPESVPVDRAVILPARESVPRRIARRPTRAFSRPPGSFRTAV